MAIKEEADFKEAVEVAIEKEQMLEVKTQMSVKEALVSLPAQMSRLDIEPKPTDVGESKEETTAAAHSYEEKVQLT